MYLSIFMFIFVIYIYVMKLKQSSNRHDNYFYLLNKHFIFYVNSIAINKPATPIRFDKMVTIIELYDL